MQNSYVHKYDEYIFIHTYIHIYVHIKPFIQISRRFFQWCSGTPEALPETLGQFWAFQNGSSWMWFSSDSGNQTVSRIKLRLNTCPELPLWPLKESIFSFSVLVYIIYVSISLSHCKT